MSHGNPGVNFEHLRDWLNRRGGAQNEVVTPKG